MRDAEFSLIAEHANLLVVFLLVELYKLARDESRTILSRAGKPDSKAAKESRLQPGRHDFFRVFCASLATNRKGTTNHGRYVAANLPDLQNTDGSTRSRAGLKQRSTVGLRGAGQTLAFRQRVQGRWADRFLRAFCSDFQLPWL